MAQAWVKLITSKQFVRYRLYIETVLRKNPEFWLPYQNINDVIRKLSDGDYSLWIGGIDPHIVCIYGITELRAHKNCSTLTVLWCHGKHGPEFYSIWLQELEKLCTLLKIDRIVIEAGRSGWEKVFKPFGFRVAAIELVKDIEHEPETTLKRHTN